MFLASTLQCGTTSHHSFSVFVPCSALLCRMNVLKLKSDGDWDSSFGSTGVGYGGGEGSLSTMGENGGQRMSVVTVEASDGRKREKPYEEKTLFFFMLFHAYYRLTCVPLGQLT